MNRKGITLAELYHVSFKDFMKNNPNLIGISKELQDVRYQHAESKRLEKINLVKEERSRLRENPNLSLESKMGSKIGHSSALQESTISKKIKEETSQAIKNEQIKLEKLKRKQVTIT